MCSRSEFTKSKYDRHISSEPSQRTATTRRIPAAAGVPKLCRHERAWRCNGSAAQNDLQHKYETQFEFKRFHSAALVALHQEKVAKSLALRSSKRRYPAVFTNRASTSTLPASPTHSRLCCRMQGKTRKPLPNILLPLCDSVASALPALTHIKRPAAAVRHRGVGPKRAKRSR